MDNPAVSSKTRGQARPDHQHVPESDPGLSTDRHFRSPRPGAGLAVVGEPLQDSSVNHRRMAQRIWTAAWAAADADEMPAALRLQFAAVRMLEIIDGRMLAAFERTGLGRLRGQIRGPGDVSPVNLPAMTGDPHRFDDAGCLPKPAGGDPTEPSSSQSHAPGGIHRRGRKAPRLPVPARQPAGRHLVQPPTIDSLD